MNRQGSKVRGRLAALGASRRGVVSVVAMMFLILFGSLAAAMAIMSKSNILTAATHQHVSRAMGAAETGLSVAAGRLAEATARFVVEKGQVDSGFGERLWAGALQSGDGLVTVLPPKSYVDPGGTPAGLVQAVAQVYANDDNTVLINGINAPTIGPAPADADPNVYMLNNWLRTPAVALTAQDANGPITGTAFQIEYAPLASGTAVRVIVTGYDFDYTTDGKPVTRRIVQDFRFVKRVDAAVLSPSRIMIGKNVMVEGDLGAVYTDVGKDYGDPLVLKSDFDGISPGLDAKLALLYTALATYDTDQDNRLRVGHPEEGPGIPDFDGSGGGDGAGADVTNDGYVDEYDAFLIEFDKNDDGKVVLSATLAAGTPSEGETAEFVDEDGDPVDEDLGLLIDSALPDRNKNRVASFKDLNGTGKFEPGSDELTDAVEVDPANVPPDLQDYIHQSGGKSWLWADQVLGYRDGAIDARDLYAKVSGRLVFRVKESDWINGQGDYMQKLRGPIDPDEGESPIKFEAPESELPDLDASSFTNSENALKGAADGDGKTFKQQVAAALGVSEGQVDSWDPSQNPSDPTQPRYFPLKGDANNDSLPDNWSTAYFEKTPYNSPNFSDWYYRPVYENMVFRNVEIPEGTNALFRNCTFVGVTYVRSTLNNSHTNWTLYGRLELDANGKPKPQPPRIIYGDGPGETSFPTMLSSEDRPVLMANPPLDKADIPDNQKGLVMGYDALPDPLLIDGMRCTDTKRLCNNIRFHDSLFVGSLVSDAPQEYTHVRNKLQFTGGTRFVSEHPTYPDDPSYNPDPDDEPEIAKSSMMLPNYSVDIGSFNSPPEQDIRLKGAIIAGVLDVRGNATIDGALLLTFKPVLGEGPLKDSQGNPVGNPALFNTTLGYFGPDDGDDESLDPNDLPLGSNGQKIVGYDTNGDGLADVGPDQPQPPGSTEVPFYGYGGITLRFDPDMVMPDGVMLPLQVDCQAWTYKETSK